MSPSGFLILLISVMSCCAAPQLEKGTGEQCGPPPVVQFGDTIKFAQSSYLSGDSVEYKCPAYYILKGNKIVRCLDGAWDEAPVCLEPCTAKEKDMKKNNIKLKWRENRKIYSEHGDYIEFVCKSGYEAPPDTQMRILCDQGKLEYPKCFKSGSCVLEEQTMITNNIYDTINTVVDPGQTITFECYEGMIPEDTLEAKCEGGKITYPKCAAPKSCTTPEILNGFLKSEERASYDSGSHVDFQCNDSFVIEGPTIVKCENGQWTDLPVCLSPCKISPEDLTKHNIELLISADPQYILNSNHIHGTELIVICKSRFTHPNQAALVIECDDGKFRYPRCFSGETACSPPPAVPNTRIHGQHKAIYASGEKVLYLCNPDYILDRFLTEEAVCENTRWINLPVCRKIGEQCGPPPTLQFGDTIGGRKGKYKSGDSVEYRCPDYYVIKGNKTVRCLDGTWDKAPVCLEPCTAEVKDMDKNNLQLRWTENRKLYSEHGDYIEFVCKSGYKAPPDTQMRILCEHGKLEFPKCFKSGFCVLQQSTMMTNNIHYTISTAVDHGQIITFRCSEGKMPEDTLEAKCERGNINYPKCTSPKSCRTPEIPNEFLRTEQQQTSYDSGSYVDFQCNDGYVINGPIFAKCENGQWTDLPVCLSPCKISLEDLTKHNIELLPSADPQYILDSNHIHGTEIRVACKPGFKRPNQGALVIECDDGKFWHPKCFANKTCRIDQDKLDQNNLELDEIHNNEVHHGDGEIVQFKCKSGFRSRGETTGTCSAEILTYPNCKEPCRLEQKKLDENNLELDEVHKNEIFYVDGEIIQFKCKNGFRRNVKPTGKCSKQTLSYQKCTARYSG